MGWEPFIDNTTTGVRFELLENKLSLSDHFSSTLSIETLTWYHISVTYDSNTKKIRHYFNGLKVGEVKASLPNVLGTIYFGEGPTGGHEYLSGKIDDVRIYNRALTDTEIQKISNDNSVVDSDSDGVIDQWDHCPNTPINSYVNRKGCPANDNSVVSGKISIKGQPLTQGTATLLQSGEIFQKSTFDNGAFNFDRIAEDKSMTIIIRKTID